MKPVMQSARAVPPGRIIKRELEARGWTQNELAEIMGRPASKISPLIRGTKRLTPRTAIELAEAFGTSPNVWTNLEAQYRLHLAERRMTRGTIARRALLFGALPVRELINRGWISDSKDISEMEEQICALLGVTNREEIPSLAASFRGSKTEEVSTAALVAWCQRARQLLREQSVSVFHAEDFRRDCIPQVLNLVESDETLSDVPGVLAEHGVRFVILPHLSGTYLDGAALVVEDQPAVALTLRYDRIDSFWFTLMHELAHVYARHSGEFLDREIDCSNGNKEEQEANSMAAEWLVPSDSLAAFVKRSRPFFSRARLEEYAVSIRRHPGVVLGRLQREGEIPYKNLRQLLVRVSGRLAGSIAN